MALKAQKMIIFSFIVCPECFLTNILWLVELNDVGKFKVASNDGHLEEIVRDGGSGSKEDEKDQNDHTSEGCGRRSTAAARNSVRHRWSFVDRDPRTRSYATHRGGHPVNHCVKWQRAYTGRAHDGMSPEYKAVAKFTKTLLIDAASRSCGRRLRTACAADFCGKGNPPLCREAQTEPPCCNNQSF